MGIIKETFGTLRDERTVEAYTITNANGASVRISNLGCAILSLMLPDRQGTLSDVVLGYDTPDEYMEKPRFIGVVVGRYANRIARGRFALHGQTYRLECNNGHNALHGGSRGFDKQIWHVAQVGGDTLRLTHTSPDGDAGYPGELAVTLTYRFNDRNELSLRYQASSNKDTVCSLTHHCYFNLCGHESGSIAGQIIQVMSDHILEVNTELIPTGRLLPVKGSAADLNTPVRFGDVHSRIGRNSLITAGKGIDFNYVLAGEGTQHCATVQDPGSGRWMEVSTDMPGIQVYSGGNLTGDVYGKGGAHYPQHSGFCLETQHYPDAPNQPGFPSALLRAGDIYDHITTYQFGIAQ